MLTRAEILSIAEAEGYYLAEYDTPDGVVVHVWTEGCITDLLEKVAAASAAAEREACAQLAKRVASDNYEGAHIAAAIRARGEEGGAA